MACKNMHGRQNEKVVLMPNRSSRSKRPSETNTLLRILGTCLGVIILGVIGLIAFLTFTEYHPADQENLEASGRATQNLAPGDELTLLTWNIGYGALGDNADFFMDGGTHVRTASEERVTQNMNDITDIVASINPDIALFQEVDQNSDRSSHINQATILSQSLDERESYFATNYKTKFVPLGIPPYGKIDGGLLTLSSFATTSATREALPLSYSWPMSTVQLKRCELVMRIPLEGSNHELVIINEHPDAYTDEEHHAAQIDAIRETLEKEAAAGNYVIAGGDWNHTFSNIDASAYPLQDENNWRPGILNEEDFDAGWQFAMDNGVPTCRLLDHPLATEDGIRFEGIVQYYLLDGFIVSNNIQIESIETQNLNFVASDHNPVVMKVTLKDD